MRLRPPPALRAAALALAACVVLPALLEAIYVSPTAVFMGMRTRDAQITVGNSGDRPEEATIELKFGFPEVDSAGTPFVRFVEDPGPEFPSAAAWIRPFPQRMRLEPGSQQIVRLLARPPADLPEGEYWTRMIVTGRGLTSSLPTTDSVVTDESGYFVKERLLPGQDGPTHQPIEHVTALRVIPRLAVLRPADANETAATWRWWLAACRGPAAFVLSRQKLPTLPGTRERAVEGVARGGYVVADDGGGTAAPDAILIATGSEVQLAVAAREELARDGLRVRVVSVPCLDTFTAQDAAYRESVLPDEVRARVAVEAGVTMPWYRWVGPHGRVLGVDTFGASAPGEQVLARYGFTVEAVVRAVRDIVAGLRG